MEIKPNFLHVVDMPMGLSMEEGLKFLATKSNPRKLPIKVFPEPVWWEAVMAGQEMIEAIEKAKK